MITFKELDKYNIILDIKRESIGILNAVVLYEKFHTDKNILHLFYNGGYDFKSIVKIIDLTSYDKIILDFSGADDFLLRFYDIDTIIA